MINKDSIVTAYDEHLTLVEWLQKVEKLITENALESVQVNNVSASTYTLTLTFADGSSITSNTFDLSTITQALTLIDAKADTALNNSVANAREITKIKNGTTPLFENITDSHGNKRFVEGDITLREDTRVTKNYGKWSLCGTHFMVVACLNIASGEAESELENFLVLNDVPEWLLDKIIPLSGNDVDVKSCVGYSTNNLSSSVFTKAFFFTKYGDNRLRILPAGFTIPQTDTNSVMRIQFDLLVDDE